MLRTDIRPLFIQTEIDMLWTSARLVERDTHVVVCEPTNPGHYWGNFIVFPHPPTAGSHAEWEAIFRREFGPDYKHFAFTWNTIDGETGDTSEFVAAGYEFVEQIVLVAEPGDIVQPPKFNAEIDVREIAADDADAWADIVELWVEGREEGHSEAAFRAYAGRAARHRRSLVRAGLGTWLAAYSDDQLVGSLGVFVVDGRGRFQAVDTHADFRRQGICGRLVHDAANIAFERFGAQQLVLVADEGYHAAGIYERCGFTPTERTPALDWWPRAT